VTSRVDVVPSGDLSDALRKGVRDLLDDAFKGEFTDEDWDHTLGGWHLIAVDGPTVISHAAVVRRVIGVAGKDYRSGYVEGVATRPDRQGQGCGSAVTVGASTLIREQLELGVLSTGLHEFYGRLGWERWQGPSFVDNSGRLVRTQEEDDGIMVLRAGPSSGIDLTAPIACRSRPGDDW